MASACDTMIGRVDLSRLTAELLEALPIDRLGLELLAALTADEPETFSTNSRNVRLNLEQGQWSTLTPQDRWMLGRRYEEALAWLHVHGLVAHDPSQDAREHIFVTAAGWDVLRDEDGLARVRAARRLDVDLHERIADRVRALYLLGEHEAAAFLAMREVEIRVRDVAGADADVLGVNLMKQAFGERGPLRDRAMPSAEADALMALYWGAIGVFKNPSSHREVAFDDPTITSEIILLADLLLRMLDRIKPTSDDT
jgi:uncharacterized protein (TIGR02391 family)